MNPLPRLLALGLVVILIALSAMLAAPTLSIFWSDPDAGAIGVKANPRAASLARLPQRLALPVSLTALVLAAGLLASLGLRSPRSGETRSPFDASRAERGALALLAEASAAQGAALARERDVRLRAEQDALLNQQRLTRSLEEKIRLGRDLHDGVIQSLYAAGLVIESVRTVARQDPVEADRRLAQCLDHLNGTIRDVRTYIAGLAPENLRQASFTQAIDALVSELNAGRDVQFDLKIDESATALLSTEQSTEALQVAREAISNSLRHGGASLVTVRLHHGDAAVCLLVQDNGTGFDPARHVGRGHGLGNMQARARTLGADVRIESRPQDGARVILTLPVTQPS